MVLLDTLRKQKDPNVVTELNCFYKNLTRRVQHSGKLIDDVMRIGGWTKIDARRCLNAEMFRDGGYTAIERFTLPQVEFWSLIYFQ